MELILTRKWFTNNSTIGELSVDGKFFCFALEDKDNGLDDEMPLDSINARKIHGLTAIPTGRYETIVNMSNRFKVLMPLLLKVKGYEGVRIHPGNKPTDTEGCILPGKTKSVDFVGQSKDAYKVLFPLMQEAIKKGDHIYLTIKREKPIV